MRVERPRLIAWTGKTLGIKAVRVWHFDPRNGKTFVRTEESYDGLVVRLFHRAIQKTLDRALADGLRYLKTEVEGTDDSRGRRHARYVRRSSTAPRSMPTSCHSASWGRMAPLVTSGSVATIASAVARSSQRRT
jgi:hypothetical protein